MIFIWDKNGLFDEFPGYVNNIIYVLNATEKIYMKGKNGTSW